MIFTIPLRPGRTYQRFKTELSGRLIRFELRWLEQYQFFAADIYEGEATITQGRGLHPGMNLVAGLLTGLGAIYLEGDAPTVNNLGIDNKLRYDDTGATS